MSRITGHDLGPVATGCSPLGRLWSLDGKFQASSRSLPARFHCYACSISSPRPTRNCLAGKRGSHVTLKHTIAPYSSMKLRRLGGTELISSLFTIAGAHTIRNQYLPFTSRRLFSELPLFQSTLASSNLCTPLPHPAFITLSDEDGALPLQMVGGPSATAFDFDMIHVPSTFLLP